MYEFPDDLIALVKRWDYKDVDAVYRYENLESDLIRSFDKMKIEKVRPVSRKNKTPQRERNYLNYFADENLRKFVISKYKRIMNELDYPFPNWQSIFTT